MKRKSADEDPLDREIDFSRGRPNPYWLGVVDRTRVRVIDKDLPDVSARRASVTKKRTAKPRSS